MFTWVDVQRNRNSRFFFFVVVVDIFGNLSQRASVN